MRLYRALISREMIDRWNRNEYTSFHGIPNDWFVVAKTGAVDPGAYPIECVEGRYTTQAREVFLERLKSRGLDQCFPRICGQMDGVYAYTDAGSAYEHARGTEGRLPGLIAEFCGKILADAPEPGGVLAEVVQPLGASLPAAEFAERHGLASSK